AFYKVVADQEGVTVARQIETIAKGIYESEQTRFEAGEVALTNVLRAEVELSQARNAVSLAEGNLQTALAELQTVMGLPEESLAGVTGRLLTTPPEVSFHDLKLTMQVNQPLIKASRKNAEMAESQLTLEKRQAIPDINVSAGYKRLTQENADTIQMGIEIPAPFFNRNQGNIQRGKALSRKAKTENQSVCNDLLLQLKRDVDSYQAERRRVAEFRDNIIPKAESSLQLIETGYKEGELTYIDLLDAQRTWAETKVSYIESLKKITLLLADIEGLAVTKIRE
ncbi:MAG: TolC family protein, partial [Planctomycetota bacterium]